jgi:hypothetical protein
MDDDEDRKEKQRRYFCEWQKKKYASDPEFRAKKLAYAKAYREANREKRRAYIRHRYATDAEFRAKKKERERKREHARTCRRYGISVEQFDEMFARQHGACGICERPFQHTPHIDHDHATHTVRGLLCNMCNLGLGHFEDNPTFLRNAARYLERWLQRISEPHNEEGKNMPTNDERNGASLIRKMLLHELHQPHGVDLPAPTDRLQAIVRGLVTQAAEVRDLNAIREVFDRVAGPPPVSAA